MKTRSDDFFWPSYVDLLTGLFIISLVLFFLSYKSLSDSKKVTEEKLRKIEEIQNAIAGLDTTYFIYNKEFKRFELKHQIEFILATAQFKSVSDIHYAHSIGYSIKSMIDSISQNHKDSIKYVVIIEGMASKGDGGTADYNYQLSYERARAIYNIWKAEKINFNTKTCELIVSGSGWDGIGRYSDEFEYKNRRILITILPKISEFRDFSSN